MLEPLQHIITLAQFAQEVTLIIRINVLHHVKAEVEIVSAIVLNASCLAHHVGHLDQIADIVSLGVDHLESLLEEIEIWILWELLCRSRSHRYEQQERHHSRS